MLQADPRHPGWVQGWGVVEGRPPSWKFAGVFQTLHEARTTAADAGPGYEVRWGSYEQHDPDFVSGNSS
jgi:hypothetical protein